MIDKHCILKSISLNIEVNGNVTVCCFSNKPYILGNIKTSTIKEIWTSYKLQEFRKSNSTQAIQHCQSCYDIEEKGSKSWRLRVNESHRNNSNNSLTLNIRFSNRCNFKCRTCGPDLSSSWRSEIKKNTNRTSTNVITSYKPDNPISVQILDVLNEVNCIYFAGGEPLLDPDHIETLRVISNNIPNIQVKYSTNLSTLEFNQIKFIPLWRKIKNLEFKVSLDGYGLVGEYIRKGLNWNSLLMNWNTLKVELPHAKLKIDITLSTYNCLHIIDLLNEVKRNNSFGVNLDDFVNIYIAYGPSIISISSMSQDLKKLVISKYNNYISQSNYLKINSQLKDAINLMINSNEDLSKDFNIYNFKLDKIRKESLKKTLPQVFINNL